MRPASTLTALLACTLVCAIASPVEAKTRNIVVGPEAAALLDEIGLPRGQCPLKRRFDLVGEFDIPAGYSGSVGEFQTPAQSFLRIDSAVSQVSGPWYFPSRQFAGAIGTWTRGRFSWYPMAGVQDGLFWVYPRPLDNHVRPIYPDKQALVKVEANRTGSIDLRAYAFFGVRGCVVDQTLSK